MLEESWKKFIKMLETVLEKISEYFPEESRKKFLQKPEREFPIEFRKKFEEFREKVLGRIPEDKVLGRKE